MKKIYLPVFVIEVILTLIVLSPVLSYQKEFSVGQFSSLALSIAIIETLALLVLGILSITSLAKGWKKYLTINIIFLAFIAYKNIAFLLGIALPRIIRTNLYLSFGYPSARALSFIIPATAFNWSIFVLAILGIVLLIVDRKLNANSQLIRQGY